MKKRLLLAPQRASFGQVLTRRASYKEDLGLRTDCFGLTKQLSTVAGDEINVLDISNGSPMRVKVPSASCIPLFGVSNQRADGVLSFGGNDKVRGVPQRD